MNVCINSISGNDIGASYIGPGIGLNLVAKGALMVFGSTIKEKLPMIDFDGDDHAVLHLGKNQPVGKCTKKMELDAVSFDRGSMLAIIT